MMRRIMVLGLLAGISVIGVGALYAAAGQNGKARLVTGKVQCLFCHLKDSDMGADPDACTVRCLQKKGMPPVIIEEGTGEVFLAVWKNGESAVSRLIPLVGSKVNAQGPIWSRGGARVIEIQVVAEAL